MQLFNLHQDLTPEWTGLATMHTSPSERKSAELWESGGFKKAAAFSNSEGNRLSKATAILAHKAARAELYNLIDWSGRKELQCDTAQQPLF